MDKNKMRYAYKCKKCGQTMKNNGSDNAPPECCGAPMEKINALPGCELTETAEHARLDEMLEPCDDGRKGKP
jgi:hypothetical protein